MSQNPILINLLPYRDAIKEVRQKEFVRKIVLAGLLGCVLSLLIWQLVSQYLNAQIEKNAFITAEIKKLDAEIAQIATLQQEIEILKARQKSVEDLQSDRNLPVYVFEELTSFVPEGVFLKSVRQEGQKITLTGVAQSQERVSEMLRNFNNISVWLEKPEVLEIKLAGTSGSIKASDKVYEFTMALFAKREKKVALPPSAGATGAVGTPKPATPMAAPSPNAVTPSPTPVPPPAQTPAVNAVKK